MEDESFSEVLVGRVFVILGVKFSELAKSEGRFRARAVYQGNNMDAVRENPSTRSSTRSPTRPRRSRRLGQQWQLDCLSACLHRIVRQPTPTSRRFWIQTPASST